MNVRGERESQMLHRRRALCHNMREEGLEEGEAHPPARPAGKWAAQPCNGHCHSTSTEQGGGGALMEDRLLCSRRCRVFKSTIQTCCNEKSLNKTL